MSSHRPARLLAHSLSAAVMIGAPIAFVAGLPWLKQQPDAVGLLVAGVVAALTIGASVILAILVDRRTDEWSRSAARFSSQWGWTGGACLVALLLALPPFRDRIVVWAAAWAGTPDPDPQLVMLAFTLGFGAVVVTQALCVLLLSIGWTAWMLRSTRGTA